jgi:hypothetical protein
MSSVALGLILMNGVLFLFSAEPKTIASPYSDKVISVGPVYLTEQRLLSMVCAASPTVSTSRTSSSRYDGTASP